MVEELLKEIAELKARIAALSQENANLAQQAEKLESEKQSLRNYIDLLKKFIFGPRSERHVPADPNRHQLRLFEDELAEEARKEIEEELRKDAAKEHDGPRPKRNGRKPLPKSLERKEVLLDLSADDKECPHGHERQKFGEEVTEELEVIPAQFFVIQYIRPKYCTPSCNHPECKGVTMASLPARPIEQGRPGAGLLAHIAVSKFGDHLPLYRQEQMFARQGIELSRSTLCEWMASVAGLLLPVVLTMKEWIFEQGCIQADESPIRVQGVRKGKTHQGYMWAFGIPWAEVVFDFSLSRSGETPVRFLEGFQGSLQVDGYDGYNGVFIGGEVKRLGCFAHVRRKFHDALKESPDEAQTILAAIQLLYRLEREMKREKLSPEERAQKRRERASPILANLEKLMRAYQNTTLPKSKFGEALTYALNEWRYLIAYVDVGEAEIDNNSIEQTIRPVAIGRKNFLFAGSPDGGRSAAILYSLITSCKRLGVNPWEYLRDVIDRVSTHPASRISELTPRGWKQERERNDATHEAASASS